MIVMCACLFEIMIYIQSTRDIEPVEAQCWHSVADGGPTPGPNMYWDTYTYLMCVTDVAV